MFTAGLSQTACCFSSQVWLFMKVLPPLAIAQSAYETWGLCCLWAEGFQFTPPRKYGPVGPAEMKVFSLLSQGPSEPRNKRSKASLQPKAHTAT